MQPQASHPDVFEPPPRGVAAICAALVAAEVTGFLAILLPVPAAWMWVGARIYDETSSLLADLIVAFGGYLASLLAGMGALNRVDQAWVQLRRRAGHAQREGALTRVVVVAMTFAMVLSWIWFHIIEDAFIIPFMPTR